MTLVYGTVVGLICGFALPAARDYRAAELVKTTRA